MARTIAPRRSRADLLVVSFKLTRLFASGLPRGELPSPAALSYGASQTMRNHRTSNSDDRAIRQSLLCRGFKDGVDHYV